VPVDISVTEDMYCATEMLSAVLTFRTRCAGVRCDFGFADETIRFFRGTDLLIRFAIATR
jgi:hypothetical protein